MDSMVTTISFFAHEKYYRQEDEDGSTGAKLGNNQSLRRLANIGGKIKDKEICVTTSVYKYL